MIQVPPRRGNLLIAQGSALGIDAFCRVRPVRAKAFYSYISVAPTGRNFCSHFTQGAALGYKLLAFQAVYLLAKVELNELTYNRMEIACGVACNLHHFLSCGEAGVQGTNGFVGSGVSSGGASRLQKRCVAHEVPLPEVIVCP